MPKKLCVFILFFTLTIIINMSAQNGEIQKLHQRSKDISDPMNTLSNKTEILELEYIVWGCACANWITVTDIKNYGASSKHCIFIEPENKKLDIPLYFMPQRYHIIVTGQFYNKEDYPKGTEETEEKMAKTKVFRYSKIEIVERPEFKPESPVETLVLSYNNIACTCAQWSELNKNKSGQETTYYFLEPANNKLLKPETLLKTTFPLKIKVTGRSLGLGYPKGYNPEKGDPEMASVFQYTSITVLNN